MYILIFICTDTCICVCLCVCVLGFNHSFAPLNRAPAVPGYRHFSGALSIHMCLCLSNLWAWKYVIQVRNINKYERQTQDYWCNLYLKRIFPGSRTRDFTVVGRYSYRYAVKDYIKLNIIIRLRLHQLRRAELIAVTAAPSFQTCFACVHMYILYECVYICVCASVYVCGHVYIIHVCMCVCICICVRLYTCVCLRVCIFVHRLLVSVSVLQRVDGVMHVHVCSCAYVCGMRSWTNCFFLLTCLFFWEK